MSRKIWAAKRLLLSRHFPEAPPLGWKIRENCGSKWVRFYALPQGKRLMVKSEQKLEMGRRFKEIALSLFSDPLGPLSILSPVEKFEDGYGRYKPDILKDYGLKQAEEEIYGRKDDGPAAFDLYFARMRLNDGRVDALVTAIMQDKVMQSLFFSDDGNVIAPYDGGFDVFTDQPTANYLKEKFAGWASDQEDGL